MTIIEIRSPKGERTPTEYARAIERACREQKAAALLAISDDTIYLTVERNGPDPGRDLTLSHCTEVHIRTNQAIVTLIGEHLKRSDLGAPLATFLAQRSALVLPQNGASCSVRIAIGQEELPALTNMLQHICFSAMDPVFFAAVESVPKEQQLTVAPRTRIDRERHRFAIRKSRFA